MGRTGGEGEWNSVIKHSFVSEVSSTSSTRKAGIWGHSLPYHLLSPPERGHFALMAVVAHGGRKWESFLALIILIL